MKDKCSISKNNFVDNKMISFILHRLLQKLPLVYFFIIRLIYRYSAKKQAVLYGSKRMNQYGQYFRPGNYERKLPKFSTSYTQNKEYRVFKCLFQANRNY